jgi:hypothetical protein
MEDIRNVIRYVSASALLILGFLLCSAGGLLMKGLHIRPHPLFGGILAISGLEIEALSYIPVRNLRFESPFRAALFILFGFPAITVLTSLAIWLCLPEDSWRWGIHFTAGQAAAYGAVGTVCALNLVYLYRRAGSGWRAKGALSSSGSPAAHVG